MGKINETALELALDSRLEQIGLSLGERYYFQDIARSLYTSRRLLKHMVEELSKNFPQEQKDQNMAKFLSTVMNVAAYLICADGEKREFFEETKDIIHKEYKTLLAYEEIGKLHYDFQLFPNGNCFV